MILSNLINDITFLFRLLWDYYVNPPKTNMKYGKNDKENQIQEIDCYKGGEYSHTIKVHYFTKEQMNEIRKIRDNN